MKPLSFMYGTKSFAPGTVAWTRVNKMITNGKSVEDIVKSENATAAAALKNARKASEAVLAGRNGLFAASVSAYMEDAHQIYPTEDEVPVVAPVEEQPQPEVQPQQQSMGTIPTDTGIAAIQQIAQMLGQAGSIEGVGTGALEQGASLARSAA